MSDDATVNAADIARLTGLGRAAVSNWRRRHDDFPKPVGGTASSPLFSLQEVEDWLLAYGKLDRVAAEDRLWQRLRAAVDEPRLGEVIGYTGAFLVYLLRAPGDWSKLARRPDREVAERLPAAVAEHAGDLPGTLPGPLAADAPALARQVAAFAAGRGPAQTFELLHDRYIAHARRVPHTPAEVAGLMAALADVRTGEEVFDPACGTGTLLLAALTRAAERAARRAREGALPRAATHPAGQERDESAARIAAVRLALHGRAPEVAVGDALRADSFHDLRADVVLCTPPYADRNWGRDELTIDPRWEYGLPAKGDSELAWVQHALARTRPGGRTLVLMPSAAAARRSGRRVRARLLRAGALRGIVSLPAGSAPASSVAPHLWLLRRPAPGDGLPTHVLMLDAAAGGGGSWQEVKTSIERRWREFQRKPGSERAAPDGRSVALIDLLDEDIDLTPARHLPRTTSPGAGYAEARDRFAESVSALQEMIPDAGLLVDAGRESQTAPLTELIKAGAVALLQAGLRMETDAGLVPVLTVRDVVADRPPTGGTPEAPGLILLRGGDVVLPATTRYDAVRVITADGGALGPHLYLLRPDPARFDPDFLAGLLRAAGRDSGSRVQSTSSRLDVRRTRIPRLTLEEQRPYGAAFRRLDEAQRAARRAAERAEAMVREGLEGIAGGGLRPRA